VKIEIPKTEYLDLEDTQQRISRSGIIPSSHVPEVEQVKGRPKWEVVEDFLKNRVGDLYRAEKTKKRRTKLWFKGSSKYDLRVIARFGGKDLIVISYNWVRKKPLKTIFDRKRIPRGKKK